MPRTPRVLLFHEEQDSLESLPTALRAQGFEVHMARSFIDAAPLLVGKRVDVLLLYLPKLEWVQRAVLHEIRRVNAKLPIVAIGVTTSESLAGQIGRLGAIHALPADVDGPSLTQVLWDAAGRIPASAE